ncbi:unspecified product [Leishmania tarentolae]|uniref:Unspecified product n=1 Tax=Leishmania tarentolae TaxID=5689 RepID=A0A640KD20_LEITA|nr:unspecified product [Leishmania tarentolae]
MESKENIVSTGLKLPDEVVSVSHNELCRYVRTVCEERACDAELRGNANDGVALEIEMKRLRGELIATKKMLWAAEDIIIDERILAAKLERSHLSPEPSLLLSLSLFFNLCAGAGICCLLLRRISKGVD